MRTAGLHHNFFLAIILFAILAELTNSKPAADRPNNQLPQDWRNLLTEDVYNYHLNKESSSSRLFESDIAGIDRAKSPATTGHLLRTAILDKNMRWANGVVPYEISNSFTPNERSIIEQALEDIMRKTCVRFVPHAQQVDYISFVRRGSGCSSYVARTGGKQLIDLQPGCIYEIGEVQHEVMHALGFYHEQSRTDRDQYVTIIWSNIQAGAEDQFKTYRSDSLDIAYDYQSIMHYGWNYFAKDASKPTILPKVKAALGSRLVVSRGDVEKINRLYECPQENTKAATTTRPRATSGASKAATTQCNRHKNGDHTRIRDGHHPDDNHGPSSTPASSVWREIKQSVKEWIRNHS